MTFRMLTFFTSVALGSLTPAIAQPVPISDPDNAGGWELIGAVSDEFEGNRLDLDKWNNLGLNGNDYGEWKGRAPSQYNPANVSVEKGFLTLTSRWEPDFKFSATKGSNGISYGQPAPVTTAAIVTKSKFKYGYLEMRCRAAEGPVSSSFWTTGVGGEIDVFEHFGENPNSPYAAKRYQASFHDWRKGSGTFGKRIWTNDHQLNFRVADDFHTYGLEWSADLVAIYVDGRLVNCVTKNEMGDKWVAFNEQKIWIDSETFDWEVPPAKLQASDFAEGRKFVIDYCRVWRRTAGRATCAQRDNLLANGGFEQGMRSWRGTADISTEAHSGKAAVILTTGGLLEQAVPVKPNTTYVLSAWGKSPQTNQKDLWFNAFLGVRGHGEKETNTRIFFPDYHEKSVQFTTGDSTTSATIFFTNQPHGKKLLIDDIELVELPERRKSVRR